MKRTLHLMVMLRSEHGSINYSTAASVWNTVFSVLSDQNLNPEIFIWEGEFCAQKKDSGVMSGQALLATGVIDEKQRSMVVGAIKKFLEELKISSDHVTCNFSAGELLTVLF